MNSDKKAIYSNKKNGGQSLVGGGARAGGTQTYVYIRMITTSILTNNRTNTRQGVLFTKYLCN